MICISCRHFIWIFRVCKLASSLSGNTVTDRHPVYSYATIILYLQTLGYIVCARSVTPYAPFLFCPYNPVVLVSSQVTIIFSNKHYKTPSNILNRNLSISVVYMGTIIGWIEIKKSRGGNMSTRVVIGEGNMCLSKINNAKQRCV